jgi:polyisoprenoid-binding protein YceI
MQRTTSLAIVTAVVFLAGGGHARAGDGRVGHFAFDPHHTVVAFHLTGNVHDVHGTFALESGTLDVDPASGAASGTIVVDATSGESGNASRDDRMANAILDVAQFPAIRFRAERVEGAPHPDGTFAAMLYGVLNLHGVDHDLAVAVDGRLTEDVLRARARFTVPYVAWGMPDPSILLLTVADTVDVDVSTEGRVTWTHE